MDGSVSGYSRKCLLIINSLHLRESFSYKSRFLFLDTSNNAMLYLIDPLGIHYRLPFWSQNNIPYIILQDGLIFLCHGILPYLLTCRFSMTRRLGINDVAHGWKVARKSFWSLALSGCALRGCMSLCLLQSLLSPGRPFMAYCNVFGDINWSNWIN